MPLLPAFLVLLTFVASGLVLRRKREGLDASYKRLSPAVPDTKAIEGAPYREQEALVSVDAPHSRKSLELLPETKRLQSIQSVVSLAAPAAAAALFATWPIAALGPWSALVGAAWGFLTASATLEDDRRQLGALALLLVPLAPFAPWPVTLSMAIYGAARTVLDQKDEAAMDEAERERLADPRYLAGSTERRAARVSLRAGGGGDITAPTARDNLKA